MIDVERDGNVAIASIERPPANALDGTMARMLGAAVADLAADDDVRVLVIRSRIDRFFMAGGDIKRYAELTPTELVEVVRGYRAVFAALHRLPQPVIGVADGHATGGGAELLLSCDFRVATKRARIGVPEIELGGLPSATGTQMLTRIVGYPRAMELMISGRSVEGPEAVAMGLATQLADGDGMGAALELAASIASKPPAAVRWIKRCARRPFDMGLGDGFQVEDEATAGVAVTEEFWDRVHAFAERSTERAKQRRTTA